MPRTPIETPFAQPTGPTHLMSLADTPYRLEKAAGGDRVDARSLRVLLAELPENRLAGPPRPRGDASSLKGRLTPSLAKATTLIPHPRCLPLPETLFGAIRRRLRRLRALVGNGGFRPHRQPPGSAPLRAGHPSPRSASDAFSTVSSSVLDEDGRRRGSAPAPREVFVSSSVLPETAAPSEASASGRAEA